MRALRLSLCLPLLFVFAVGCPSREDPPTVVHLGDGEVKARVELDPFSIVVMRDGRQVLHTLTEPEGSAAAPGATVDSPTYESLLLPGWDGYRAKEGAWVRGLRATLKETRAPASATLEVVGDGVVFTLDVSVTGDAVVVDVHAQRPAGQEGRAYNKVGFAFEATEDERFFGMGERFASSNHRGHSLYSWAEEGALGGGEGTPAGPENPYPNGPSMTYFPVPFFLSSQGYAVHLDTTVRTEVHFASEAQNVLRVAANSDSLRMKIYVNEDPLKSLDAFTRDTGRPLVPSPWAFGTRRRISRSYMVDGVPEWQRMRELSIPITGVDDSVHFLPHRAELGKEAELQQWTSTLHDNGFKVLGYYNPYVSQSRPEAAADYAHGKDNGFFIKGPDGEPSLTWFISGKVQYIAAIDLTRPAAVDWFHTLLQRAYDLGYDGWMHDFGEYVARDAHLWDGRRGAEVHNEYPVLSAKAAWDFWQDRRKEDFFFFVRSGYTGTQAYAPGVWGGDAEATFDETQGLPSALRSGVNLGLTGVPYWGSDVSGFKCITDDPRDKEVYLRWVQLGAVSPIFMDQDACSHPTEDRTKWTLWSDTETIDVFREMSSLHTRLQPYFLSLAKTANQTGAPLMRHPFLVHPKEPRAWDIEEAFYLGKALYALPVVRRGQVTKDTWLPPGRFVDLLDFTVYEGARDVSIPAPLTKLPLLLVAGELLPLLDPSVQTLAPATVESVVTADDVKDVLDVVVALGPGREATLTLADGTVLTAKRGVSDEGNPEGLSVVAASALPDCSKCFSRSFEGDLSRVRANSALASKSTVRIDDLELTATAPDTGPFRRIRWDVLRLP